MTQVYDQDGIERSLEWLAQEYDGCTVLPANTGNASAVWRLETIIVTDGAPTLTLEARRGLWPAERQAVALTWPSLASPSMDLDTLMNIPTNWASRGVIGWTDSDGVYGAGLGETFGPWYHAWVQDSAPSDCLTKTGMKGGTNCRGPLRGVWVLQPVAEAHHG